MSYLDINIRQDVTENDIGFTVPDLPEDYYVCAIKSVENGPNGSNTGQRLCISMEILAGEFKGARLWDYIAYEHPKAEVMEKAANRWSLIVNVLGITQEKIREVGLPLFNDKVISVKCKTTLDREKKKQISVFNYRAKSIGEAEHSNAKASQNTSSEESEDDAFDDDIPF